MGRYLLLAGSFRGEVLVADGQLHLYTGVRGVGTFKLKLKDICLFNLSNVDGLLLRNLTKGSKSIARRLSHLHSPSIYNGWEFIFTISSEIDCQMLAERAMDNKCTAVRAEQNLWSNLIRWRPFRSAGFLETIFTLCLKIIAVPRSLILYFDRLGRR